MNGLPSVASASCLILLKIKHGSCQRQWGRLKERRSQRALQLSSHESTIIDKIGQAPSLLDDLRRGAVPSCRGSQPSLLPPMLCTVRTIGTTATKAMVIYGKQF